MRIKAITMDVGGTLAEGELNRESYQKEVANYLRSLGFDKTTEDYRKATRIAFKELNLRRKRYVEMKFETFCSMILSNLGIPPAHEFIEKMRTIYFECFPQTEKRGAREVLRELSGRYKLAAVSNSMSLAPRRFLEKANFARYFEVIAVSGEIGYRKPHPKIFEYTLEKLGVRPNEAVHVGDSIEEDVSGAKNVGMRTVLISDKKVEKARIGPDLIVNSIFSIHSAIKSIET